MDFPAGFAIQNPASLIIKDAPADQVPYHLEWVLQWATRLAINIDGLPRLLKRSVISGMRVDEIDVPENLYYSKEHQWLSVDGERCRVGLTDYAQKQLREIVFVELPSAGGSVSANAPFGSVESVKAVSDLISPLTGTIDQINPDVTSKPETLNEDPFGKGWLLIIKPSNLNAELSALMDFNKSMEWHKSLIAKG